MAGLTIGTLSPGPGLAPGLSAVLTSPPVLEAGLAVTLGSVSRTMTLTLCIQRPGLVTGGWLVTSSILSILCSALMSLADPALTGPRSG